MLQSQYTDDEWRASTGHQPVRGLDLSQLLLLHRHWIWANRQRALLDAELHAGRIPRPDGMAEDSMSAMFLWYALLWVVIEGFDERAIELRGRFAEEIASLSDAFASMQERGVPRLA